MNINDAGYLRDVFDSLPISIFIIDSELRIHDANREAIKTFIGDSSTFLTAHLCGDVLRCLNAIKSESGCGKTEFCPDCVVRNSVYATLKGEKTYRRRHKMRLLRNQMAEQVHLLITASPFTQDDKPLAMVVLEDITELVALRQIIPICSHCKKVRQGDKYWEQVENYINRFMDVTFTHAICPECAEKYYPGYNLNDE